MLFMNETDTEIFFLKKSEELSPKVSYWYSLLDETRGRLLRILKKLTDEELDYSPNEEFFETIGTLLLHIAGVEWSWIFEDIDGKEMDYEEFKYGFALRPDVNLPQLKGKSKQYYMDKLEKVRKQVLERLKNLSDEELVKQVGSSSEKYSIEWILFHILEHEAMHIGQILFLKRLYSKRS